LPTIRIKRGANSPPILRDGELAYSKNTKTLYIGNGTNNDVFSAISKKYATVVIGTSTNGHTADLCDFLCSGTNDEVIIMNAINSLSSHGGRVMLLDGKYNISNTIKIEKSNVTLEGTGNGSNLFRVAYNYDVINVTDSGCSIKNLSINSNKTSNSIAFSTIKILNGSVSNIYFYNICEQSCIIAEQSIIESNILDNINAVGIECKNYAQVSNNSIYSTESNLNSVGVNIVNKNNVVSANLINNLNIGLRIISGSNNLISSNNLKDATTNIRLENANDNIISNNICMDSVDNLNKNSIFINNTSKRNIITNNITFGKKITNESPFSNNNLIEMITS